MPNKTDSFDDYDDDDLEYDDIDDVDSADSNEDEKVFQNITPKKRASAWREIEEFWDNYEMIKQMKRDSNSESYYDFLLDGELN